MVDSIPPINIGTLAPLKPTKNDEKKKDKEQQKKDESPEENGRLGVNIDERC